MTHAYTRLDQLLDRITQDNYATEQEARCIDKQVRSEVFDDPSDAFDDLLAPA